MPKLNINDIKIYYEIHGSGEPLVLILGLGSDISSYKHIIYYLAKSYKVIAFDNRGAGRSDKPQTKYSMDIMASDTIGLMNKLNIKQAYILGTSMGGRIALSLALNYPKRVKKLILTCTFASRGKKVRLSWPTKLIYPFRFLPPFRGKYHQPRYAYELQRDAVLDYDVTNRLSEIKLPTLILHGQKDRTVPFKDAKFLNKNIKGSELVAFNGGHLFFILGERQKFLETVNDWLDK
jgi:pimeloyl-ACP methyl ester carboxylesterase